MPVERSNNAITIVGPMDGWALHDLMGLIREVQSKGYEDMALDFAGCDRAFPDAMVPLVAFVDSLHDRLEAEIVLPNAEDLSRLFINANWAHFLAPAQVQQSPAPEHRHVSTRRFRSLKEQQSFVSDFIDVVLRSASLSREVLQGLEWSLNEVTDNVLNHAQAARGGFAQATSFQDSFTFTVADAGIGVLASLREAMPRLRNDSEALENAVRSGVTRNPERGQGNGLTGTMRVASLSGGNFGISSGRGRLSVFTDPDKQLVSRTGGLPPQKAFPGTVVTATVMHDPSFKMQEAMGFSGPAGHFVDTIEIKYETDDGAALKLRMADEKSGCGTRLAGEQVRNKCVNLMNADRRKPLVIDWADIPVIASSFADEVFGMLFVDLGPIAFGARIRHVNLDPLVRGLLDKAIVERAAESASREGRGRPGT